MWWRWKCKPLSWLWGLIPLALLGLIAVYSERSTIENDLKKRAELSLRNAGMDWAELSFKGRDGVVFGKALTPEEKVIAMDALKDVPGIRIVDDESGFLHAVSPYLWSAEMEKYKMTLDGYVPSLDLRNEIVAEARKLFPRLSIENKMQIAPGNPARVDWKEAVLYGMKQMKGLEKGSLHFEDERFTIKGDALNSKEYVSLQDNLRHDLPEGVSLRENLVNPPVQKPYVWKMEKTEGKVTLTGFVPTVTARDRMMDVIKRKFPDQTIDDATKLGSGTPDDWQKTVTLMINELSLLDVGEAKIVNHKITFKGKASSESLANRVKSEMSSILPKGYKSVNDITWRRSRDRTSPNGSGRDGAFGGWAESGRDSDKNTGKAPGDRDSDFDRNTAQGFGNDTSDPFKQPRETVKPQVATISPYVWSATRKNDAIIVSGYVLSEQMRRTIITQARDKFPELEVIDNMKIGAGGLGEKDQMRVTEYAFQRLAALAYGTLTLIDDKVRLSGEAMKNGFTVDDFATSYLPRGVELVNAYIRPAKITNYIWDATRTGNDIILSGFVKDEQMRQTILKTAKRSFPSLTVLDQMKTASGVPDGVDWLDGMRFCLKQLDGLKDGIVGLRNRGYHLVGTAWSFDDQKALNLAKAHIPVGFNLSDMRIALPVVEPYVSRIDYQAQRVTFSGYAPSQAVKDELMLSIEERFPGATVIDQVEISAGARKGWENTVKAGIYAVSRLSQGSATLIDTDMTIRGVASNSFVKTEIGDELRRSLPRNIVLENNVRVPEADSNADRDAAFSKYESENEKYAQVTDAELNSDTHVKAPTCERYLNALVRRSSINFSPASAKLDKKSHTVLQKLAFVANRCEEASIEIAGHTDSDGSEQFNLFLSRKRALSVAEFLVNRGVNKDRLIAVGYGETQPIVPNNSKENKRKNRRIMFVVKDRY